MTSNPVEVIMTLDRELSHEVTLILYGRAALCLGFDSPPEVFKTTQDVDAIISLSQLPGMMDDQDFWDALDRTNKALESKGLYLTHLFSEDQVFLRPDWLNYIVPIEQPKTRNLRLYRPHVIDLILTKMMRGNDPQDMDDIRFLCTRQSISPEQIEDAFASVRIPEIQELRDAFDRAQPIVRSIVAAG